MSAPLSFAALRRASPQPGEFWDPGRTPHLLGSQRHSETRRTTYGAYPAISLAEARARAKEIAAAAARGIDLPSAEEREREEQQRAADRPLTVGDLLNRYVADYCKPNQRKWKMTERLFEMHVKPTLGRRPLTELRRADVVELLEELQNEKGLRAQVNRVREHVVAALNWAIEHEWIE